MFSHFGDEMLKIAVSKCMSPGMQTRKGRRPMRVANYAKKESVSPWSEKKALGKVQQGLIAGAAGTLAAQTGFKDWKAGRQVRQERKRQMKAQRLMMRR